MDNCGETLFTFGKFKGYTVRQLLNNVDMTCYNRNKSYILWCLDNVAGFTITDDERKLLESKITGNNETLFTFGKFKGHTVKELLNDSMMNSIYGCLRGVPGFDMNGCNSNRKYVWWCLDNIRGFTITNEEMKLLGPRFVNGYSYETDPYDPDCPAYEG
jgi:hypothetical protein